MVKIYIPIKDAEEIDYMLTHEPKSKAECVPEGEVLGYIINLASPYCMVIRICGVEYEPDGHNLPWGEAILYEDGIEVACTDAISKFFGEWKITYKGEEFVVCIEREQQKNITYIGYGKEIENEINA